MRLGLVAGEVSDLLAGLLLGGVLQRWPGVKSFGIGGPRMAERGFEAWWPHDKLAVRGYVEVLRHYLEIKGIRDRLAVRMQEARPDAFIGVDAPDFNLGLEAKLRSQGLRTIHFVCPSIWAWRAGRVGRIARSADHVLCLFPFEPALLAAAGIAASYVGHPLADAIELVPPRAQARAALGIAASQPVVALLPGSRRSEIETIAPTFLAAAARLARARPELLFVLPVVAGLRARVEPLVRRWAGDAPVQLVDGRSHEALAACDVTLVASGTATLEAALFKRPMVIGYRMHPLSWQMMKRMQLQPWVGLPNILCGDFVVPERIQSAATPERLAADVLAWLDAPSKGEALAARFTELHHLLRRDTARLACDAIAQVVQAA
jgi:lipid-A-disaccharide synthase